MSELTTALPRAASTDADDPRYRPDLGGDGVYASDPIGHDGFNNRASKSLDRRKSEQGLGGDTTYVSLVYRILDLWNRH